MISAGHRRRLNRALHELRRPLQALALLDARGDHGSGQMPAAARRGLMDLAASALEELEAVVNGSRAERPPRELSFRALVIASLERWRGAAGAEGIRLFWDAGPAPVLGDPIELSQALDNLVANALEHGRPPIVVTGAEVAGRLRLTVANGHAGSSLREAGEALPSSDPRRGHGTALVSELATAYGGRFALCLNGAGCVAALELPLVSRPALAGAA